MAPTPPSNASWGILGTQILRCYNGGMTTTDLPLADLSDDQLLARADALVERERTAIADLIAALAEIAARALFLALGCSSLYKYCREILHLSEDAAYDRMEAARTALRYPEVLERLANGSLSLSTLRLLIPVLTDENHKDLLDRASFKSKREVAEMIAALRPHRLPYRTVITPVSGDQFRMQVTISRETYDKLMHAQDLLRYALPDGDVATVLDRALTLLVKQLEKRKAGMTDRPRTRIPVTAASRHIPAAVRRAVWKRDGGQCAYVGSAGRCTATAYVDFHHEIPESEGGPSTVANISLRCHAHNLYEWEEYLEEHVEDVDQATWEQMCAETGPGTDWEDDQ